MADIDACHLAGGSITPQLIGCSSHTWASLYPTAVSAWLPPIHTCLVLQASMKTVGRSLLEATSGSGSLLRLPTEDDLASIAASRGASAGSVGDILRDAQKAALASDPSLTPAGPSSHLHALPCLWACSVTAPTLTHPPPPPSPLPSPPGGHSLAYVGWHQHACRHHSHVGNCFSSVMFRTIRC